MSKKISIENKILSKNQTIADELRELFNQKRILTVNFVSSPGSGKTSLLENMLVKMKDKYKIAVIEGDLETENDANRIRKKGVPAHQIITKGDCHLEAVGIKKALEHFDLENLDLLIIENVGNLVCPSSFDLGEDFKVVMISTTEGEDKPAKYPSMIHVSSAIIINKIDLLPYLDFNVEKCFKYAKGINPSLETFTTSCKTGEGIDEFVNWLENKLLEKKSR